MAAPPHTTELKVKTLQGKMWTVAVEQTDTIAIVKKKLEDKEAGPVEAQRLIFGGKILEDAKTVAEYELTKDENPAPLFLVINPEAAKKAEEAKKKAAEEAKRAADAAKANAAKEDPAAAANTISNVAKKLGNAKTIHELVQTIEKEIAALKPQPKPKGAGRWTCAACTAINPAAKTRCEMCETPNPDAPKGGGGGGGGGGGAGAPWVCVTCTYNNAAGARRCGMCDTPNPAAPPAPPRQPVRPPVDDGSDGGGDF